MTDRKVSISLPRTQSAGKVRRNTMTSEALLPKQPSRPAPQRGQHPQDRRTVKGAVADSMLAKDEIHSYLRAQHANKLSMKKDSSTQTTESGKQQSPVMDQFNSLVKGMPFQEHGYFRDWLDLSGRLSSGDLEGIITPEELIAQFAFHLGNMLEERAGREGQSMLSKMQETEIEMRVDRIRREFEERAKQEEIANREKLRGEIAIALEQAKQANTITGSKELTQLKLEQALYNSTLTALREELSQREERIETQDMDIEDLKEQVRSLGDAFEGLRRAKDQAVAAAEQRSIAHTQENELQLTKLGAKLTDQGETLLRYHSQLQVMRRDFQTQAERVQKAHEAELLSLKGTNMSLQSELDALHKKYVDLVKDHSKVTGQQTHVLANLARNNLLMVERQHKPAKLRIRMGATISSEPSEDEKRPSATTARQQLNKFQPIRDPVLNFKP